MAKSNGQKRSLVYTIGGLPENPPITQASAGIDKNLAHRLLATHLLRFCGS
jgi:hypothetical protein